MSTRGCVKVGSASTCVDSTVPYSTITRRERSRKLAQKRRDTYKNIMEDLTGVLPFPSDMISQLDYNSRLRLAVCFFRLKTMTDAEDDAASCSYTSGSSERQGSPKSGKQIVKKNPPTDQKPALFQPGMLQELMSEALDGFMMVIQVDGTVVFLSESVHKHLGLFQSEYIGMTVYDMMLEEDHEDVRKKISEAEAKSLTRTTKLGTTRISFFCRMKCSRSKVGNTITRSPGYKLVYVTGTLKVSRSEPFIACIVHPVSPPSILELRMEGNMFVTHYAMDMTCLFFDGRLRQLLGYSKADLVGSTPFTLHHHEDTEATLQCSRGIMSRGEGLSGYYRFLSNYGEYVWLQTRATMMHDSRTGQPSYIVCMNFIISKEDGNKDLELRQAIASGDSKISSDSDHAHDPFPLNEREDGKVVDPLQGKAGAEMSSKPLNAKEEEEPSSTVEIERNSPTLDEEGSSSTGSSSQIIGEESVSNTTPLVTVDASSDSDVNAGPSSIPPVAVNVSTEMKQSPKSVSNAESTGCCISSSSSRSSFSSGSLDNTPAAPLQSTTVLPARSIDFHSSCYPDSTTLSVSSTSSNCQPASCQNVDAKPNRTVSGDQGYHSVSSSKGGQGLMLSSVGTESEVTGTSSCAYRGSPESSLYPPFSPEYPQSVFSSDGSLPPPSNPALSHVEPLESNSIPGTTVLHHPSSQTPQVMTTVTQLSQPVQQVTPLKPVIPVMPPNQVTPTQQMQASATYSSQFSSGRLTHSSNFDIQGQGSYQQIGYQPRVDGRHAVIGNGHGSSQFPQQNYYDIASPTVFPSLTADQSHGVTLVKAEPSSPLHYTPIYMRGNQIPQPQGTTAIFTGPQYHLEGQRFHQQNVGTQVFTTSTAGFSSMYPASGSRVGQVASSLPQLTGEDLQMLDVFDRFSGRQGSERGQHYGAQPPTLPLNYHGNVLM